MARTIKDIPIIANPQVIVNSVHAYLMSEGYVYTYDKGVPVYKKGNGFTMGPTYIRFLASANMVRIEAWRKFAILPGVYCGEISLESGVGFAVKGPVKQRVSYIESIVMQANMQANQQPPQYNNVQQQYYGGYNNNGY